MTSKPLLSSEKAKKRVFSDDYQSLPDVQIEECHNTRQARRRASFGDVVDMIHSPRLPRARSYDSVVFNFRDVAAEDFAVSIPVCLAFRSLSYYHSISCKIRVYIIYVKSISVFQ
jgi:hypothetical protein